MKKYYRLRNSQGAFRIIFFSYSQLCDCSVYFSLLARVNLSFDAICYVPCSSCLCPSILLEEDYSEGSLRISQSIIFFHRLLLRVSSIKRKCELARVTLSFDAICYVPCSSCLCSSPSILLPSSINHPPFLFLCSSLSPPSPVPNLS